MKNIYIGWYMETPLQLHEFDEVEQRWAIDPRCWLILPKKYQIFHQAEIASWPAHDVIQEFRHRISRLWHGDKAAMEYEKQLSKLIELNTQNHEYIKRVKLRVRSITNPLTKKKTWQLTLKEKIKSMNWFKRYREYDVTISFALAEDMIQCVSLNGGVNKNRYNIAWPDGKIWDIDQILGNDNYIDELGFQFMLWEIEVTSIDESFVRPSWAIHRLNGNKHFKPFWTAQLQETPWKRMSKKTQERYLNLFTPPQEKVNATKKIITPPSASSSHPPPPLE